MKSCKGKRCHLRFFIFIPFTLATKMFMERKLLSSIKGSPNDNDNRNRRQKDARKDIKLGKLWE